MRFAVKTRPEHQSWDELRDIWVAADEVPLFESIWNWDHFYPLTGDLTGPNFEGWTMLSAMAALTSRIRVGCQVTAAPYRHPAVLANMAATVDQISSGRLILGIGAAWNEMECNAYGMPLPPLKERFDRFDEGLEVITRLLSSPVANYSGEYFTLTDARCEPKQILRGHCADVGRDFSEITCSVTVRWDGSDYDALRASVAQWRDAGVDLAVIGLPTHAKPESLSTIADAVGSLG